MYRKEEDHMGNLVEPSLREKYSKADLIHKIKTYESIQSEINRIKNQIRNTEKPLSEDDIIKHKEKHQ